MTSMHAPFKDEVERKMTSGHRILRCESRRLTAPVMLFGLSSRSPRPKAIGFIAVLQRDTSRADFGSSSPTCPATQSGLHDHRHAAQQDDLVAPASEQHKWYGEAEHTAARYSQNAGDQVTPNSNTSSDGTKKWDCLSLSVCPRTY